MVATTDTRPAGVLFTAIVLAGVAGLLVAAAWTRQTAVVIPLGLVLSMAGLSFLWSRCALRGVSCERTMSAVRVFPGEMIELTLRLSNRKALPLPWISVCDRIPQGIDLPGVTADPGITPSPQVAADPAPPTSLEAGDSAGVDGLPLAGEEAPGAPAPNLVERTTALSWYAAASWEQQVVCRRRGYYQLGPLAVTSGDIFGLYARTVVLKEPGAVIVYPRLYELAEMGLPARAFLGETRTPTRIFEDPTRTVGVREYLPGDSLRRVHWKATARQGRLQVKVLEPTTTHKAALFLVIDSLADCTEDEFELAVSAVASAARHLLERSGQVGLWVNSRPADGGRSARLPAAGGQDQLVQILEALAKVTRIAGVDFPAFFSAERENLSFGTTPVFTLARVDSASRAIIADLRDAGLQPVVAQVGEGRPGDRVPGVTWHVVRGPGRKTVGAWDRTAVPA